MCGEPEKSIVDKHTKNQNCKNPLKAIREKCLDCCGGSSSDVKACTAQWCALYPFRFGRNPYRTKRKLTDEQRTAAIERLKKANRGKKNG